MADQRRIIITKEQLLKDLAPKRESLLSRIKGAIGFSNVRLSDNSLHEVRDWVIDRIFVQGLNSNLELMQKAKWRERFDQRGKLTAGETKRGKKVKKGLFKRVFEEDYASEELIKQYPYRFRSGRLKNSFSVEQRRDSIVFVWKYSNVVLKSLEDRDGEIFGPARTEMDLLRWMYLRATGRLDKDTPKPRQPKR